MGRRGTPRASPSVQRWLLRAGGGPGRDELILDLFLDHLEPHFGVSSTILKVFNLRPQLVHLTLDGSKLSRESVGQIHGAVTVGFRHVGRLLKCSNDRRSGPICRIAIIAPPDLTSLLGRSRRALIHRWPPSLRVSGKAAWRITHRKPIHGQPSSGNDRPLSLI